MYYIAILLMKNFTNSNMVQYKYKKGYKHYSMYLKPSFVKKLEEEHFNKQELYFSSGVFQNEQLALRLINILNQNETKQSNKIDFECEIINTLTTLFSRNSKAKESVNFLAHDKMISRAKEFINDNLHLDIALGDISDELDVSKYHFLRLFKQKTHISPHNYLMLKRIEKAKHFLQKGESLINTAYSCGFNDQSHLNRRFKSLVGVTPGTYKNFFS